MNGFNHHQNSSKYYDDENEEEMNLSSSSGRGGNGIIENNVVYVVDPETGRYVKEVHQDDQQQQQEDVLRQGNHQQQDDQNNSYYVDDCDEYVPTTTTADRGTASRKKGQRKWLAVTIAVAVVVVCFVLYNSTSSSRATKTATSDIVIENNNDQTHEQVQSSSSSVTTTATMGNSATSVGGGGSSSSSSSGTTTTAVESSSETNNDSNFSSESKQQQQQQQQAIVFTDVHIDEFGPNIMNGYKQEEDLQNDIEGAAYMMFNTVATSNRSDSTQDEEEEESSRRTPHLTSAAASHGYKPSSSSSMVQMLIDSGTWYMPPASSQEQTAYTAMSVTDGTTTTASSSSSSFGTNNQEQNVEQGDVVVSDGTYVYGAYDNVIVVWDAATGIIVSRLVIPTPEEHSAERIKPLTSPLSSSSSSVGSTGQPILLGTKPFMDDPNSIVEPRIQSLALAADDNNNNKLIVMINGYNAINMKEDFFSYATTSGTNAPILGNGYLATNVRIYDTSSLRGIAENQTLNLLHQFDLNGHLRGIRIMNNNAHIVTMSIVDTYTQLLSPFETMIMNGSSKTDGSRIVTQTRDTVSAFTQRLMSELKADTGSVPKLTRINQWQSSSSSQTTSGSSGTGPYRYDDGVLSTLMTVTSFDLSDDSALKMAATNNAAAGTLLKQTGGFFPSFWSEIYANTDAMIFTVQAWDAARVQTTYVLTLSLQNNVAVAQSVGTVPGYLINSESISVRNGVLRMGTVVQNPKDGNVENYLLTMSMGSTSTEQKQQYSLGRIPSLMSSSTTSGANAGTMTALGKLQLGKINERFMSIKFLGGGDMAVAITFDRTDPFYVLDLSDPSNPIITGTIEGTTGFARYLYPMKNHDDTMLIGIGEETNIEGVTVGLKIMLYDISNVQDPVVAAEYTLETEYDVDSTSMSFWDFLSVRYINDSLIIPIEITSSSSSMHSATDNFKGFKSFHISDKHGGTIEEECTISHSGTQNSATTDYHHGLIRGYNDGSSGSEEGSDDGATCTPCTMMPPRSMVFRSNGGGRDDGIIDIMTIQGSTVKSTNLEKCKEEWNLPITIPKTTPSSSSSSSGTSCCHY